MNISDTSMITNDNNDKIVDLKPEFLITKVITITKFIEEQLAEKIKTAIPIHFSNAKDAKFKKDYKIVINDLHGDNILQDKKLLIKVIPIKLKKIKEKLLFSATIIYDYDYNEQLKVIDGILNSAIPEKFLADIPKRKFSLLSKENCKIDQQKNNNNLLKKVIPLRVLLSEPHLTTKIFCELQASSDQSYIYSLWYGVWLTETNSTPNDIIIPNKINAIKNVTHLYQAKNSYFNQVFSLIQEKLNNSGVEGCTVTKTTIKDKNNEDFCYALGNINFIEDAIEEITADWNRDMYHERSLYLQVNLEVSFKHTKKLYPGVVLLLSSKLSLYDNPLPILQSAPTNFESEEQIDEKEKAEIEKIFANAPGWF